MKTAEDSEDSGLCDRWFLPNALFSHKLNAGVRDDVCRKSHAAEMKLTLPRFYKALQN